uniref:Uncharacterized protein n=1 Tax=Arundo donax TaxID=35708 RepID=A0A0A9GGP5_ARUDO
MPLPESQPCKSPVGNVFRHKTRIAGHFYLKEFSGLDCAIAQVTID